MQHQWQSFSFSLLLLEEETNPVTHLKLREPWMTVCWLSNAEMQ